MRTHRSPHRPSSSRLSAGQHGRTSLHTARQRRRLLAAAALTLLGALAALCLASAAITWTFGGRAQIPTVHIHGFGLTSLDELRDLTNSVPTPTPTPTPAHPAPTAAAPTSSTPSAGAPSVPAPLTPPHNPEADTPPDAVSDASGTPGITVIWPAPPALIAAVAAPIWTAWLRLLWRPTRAALRQHARHLGLASLAEIRRAMGAAAVRRAGRFTLPTSTARDRAALPTTAFGYALGQPHTPHGRRRVWANWEQRIRLVCRPGWGKTDRLLVPISRDLPGPAVISSAEPGIFDKTVTARRFRRDRRRFALLDLILRPRPRREYPVVVVDFSAPEHRFAAGFPRLRWSLVLDCSDFATAHRRADALVSTVDTGHTHSRDDDKFFRDSATAVLASWLHAADLDTRDLDDLLTWHDRPDDPTPIRILRDHPQADRAAAANLRTHLDRDAGRTTSGVRRYLALALNALSDPDARDLCGARDQHVDLSTLIHDRGTIYLLADPSRLDRVRPLLGLLADEIFLAAEATALRTRQRRLPLPFVGVFDELHSAIPVPSLPTVATTMRKHGVGFVYAVQSSAQEDIRYGPAAAAALRASAGVSIYGGIDIDSAREITDRAGTTTVVTPTRGTGTHGLSRHTEHIQLQPTLTIGDQQRLADGEATCIARGLAPFLIHVPSYRDHSTTRRTIDREAHDVARHVTGARAREHTIHTAPNTNIAVTNPSVTTGPGRAPQGPAVGPPGDPT